MRMLRITFVFSLLALILSVAALFIVQHGRTQYVPDRGRAETPVTQPVPDASSAAQEALTESVAAPVTQPEPSAVGIPLQPDTAASQESTQERQTPTGTPEELLASRAESGLTDGRIAALMAENRGRYYFDHISEREQHLYAELYHILSTRVSDVYLTETDADLIEKVQNCVMNDHPEIFYVTGYYSTRYTLNDETIGYAFTGRIPLDEAEIASRSAQIEQYVSNCLAGVNPGWDDYGKVRYIYDYLIANTSYNLEAPDNQNICSVMIGRQSVCQGYAKAVQLLLNRLGIPCTLVIGTANSAAISGSHAWNMVFADGNWYHLDVTWGDASFRDAETESEGTNYDYLLTTTADISATHTIGTVVDMPWCDRMDDNYYVREGAYFSEASLDAFGALTRRRYDEGADCVRFKCATQEVYAQMVSLLVDEKYIFDYIYKAPGESLLFTRSDAQRSFTVWF